MHVHGLGINPADGALFVATHTGLFRAPPGEQTAKRVAGRYQDTMGFTVVGPDRFLGSGHPDGREKLPPFLGLISSTNAGESWEPVSLMGKADFHVLEARGKRVYGFGSDYETRKERLLASDDGGKTWAERALPESLLSLAIAPGDANRLLAAGARSTYLSEDGARTWEPQSDGGGLLAWTAAGRIYRVSADGTVQVANSESSRWRQIGDVGGEPAAFEAVGEELYIAIHDGTIMRSVDGGRTWTVRSRPQATVSE